MPWIDNVTMQVWLGFGASPFAASPSFTDVTTDVRAIQTDRGRSSTRRPFEPGTGILVLDNTAGEYDPNNSAATHFGDLNIGTPVRIRVVHDTITYTIFFGYVSRWPLVFDMPNESTVPLEITEASALFRAYHLEAVNYSEEAPGTRLGNILDDVGWPAGRRTIETGLTDKVAAVTYTGDAGSLIDETVDAEQGHFWMSAGGSTIFRARDHYSSASAAATFGGAGLPYARPVFRYDDDLLVNNSTVTGADDSAQTATDATSIATYGPSPSSLGTIDNDTIHSAPYALNVAEWLVLKYKDINVRVAGLTLYPDSDEANLYPQVLGRELGDVINVEFTPPSGDTLDQDVRIEGIRHDIRPGSWVTEWRCDTLATIETTDFWVLGTSLLGTGTVLA